MQINPSISVFDQDQKAVLHSLEKVRWILANHKPEPLPEDVLVGIRQIVINTEKELGVA